VVLSPDFIERHDAIHIFRGYRTTEGAACQVFRDLARTRGLTYCFYFRLRPLGLALRGIANKDQAPAGSFRNAGRVERPDDFDPVAKSRHAAVAGTKPESANAIESRADVLVRLHMGTIDKSDCHVMYAGCNLHRNF